VDYLVRNGFDAVPARNGREMGQALERHAIDLVVLDLMLPDTDGLVLCRDLRARSSIPVLMLTRAAKRPTASWASRWVPTTTSFKPFSPRELLARIKGILRRTRSLPPNLKPDTQRWPRLRRWRLDTATRVLTGADGVATPLSGAEYRLLRILLDHPNRVLNRDQLVELIMAAKPSPMTGRSTCRSAACASACRTMGAKRA